MQPTPNPQQNFNSFASAANQQQQQFQGRNSTGGQYVHANSVPQQPVIHTFNQQCRSEADLIETQLNRVASISPAFGTLLGIEREIDLLLTYQKQQIEELLTFHQSTTQKILKMTVSSTHSNQKAYCSGDNDSMSVLLEKPRWSLRIEGKIMNQINNNNNIKFSTLFKKIFIIIDHVKSKKDNDDDYANYFQNNNNNPPLEKFEWDSSQNNGAYDGFEIQRLGDEETVARIYLQQEFFSEKFNVNIDLKNILEISTPISLSHLIIHFCNYVKKNKLLCSDNMTINLDDNLSRIFSKNEITKSEIPSLLENYVFACDPIQIFFPIKFTQKSNKQEYEIKVDIPNTISPTLNAFTLRNADTIRQNNLTNDKIKTLIKEIDGREKKRTVLKAFAESPADVIEKSMNSRKDLFDNSHEERLLACTQDSVDNNIDDYLFNIYAQQQLVLDARANMK
jgi:hypothetical protein